MLDALTTLTFKTTDGRVHRITVADFQLQPYAYNTLETQLDTYGGDGPMHPEEAE